MAEWTNLFDLGECTVKVFDPAFEIFSQVMAKGDSATFERFDPDDSSIEVTAEGEVICEGIAADSGVMVAVIPSYEHDYAARVRATDLPTNTSFAAAGINYGTFDGGEQGVDYEDYTEVDPPAPDPLDLSALTGTKDGVFVFSGGGN